MSAKPTAKRASREYEKQQGAGETPPPKYERGPLEDYLPLVKYIAGRLAIGLPRSVEMDDLINAGVVGLIEAYSNFNVEKGVKFETYASLRVRGSILDELRGMDWVPRSTRARSREIERTISRLEGDLGRSPSETELAGGLGVELKEYYAMIDDVSSTALLSLDEMTHGEDDDRPVPLVDTLKAPDANAALTRLEAEEMRNLLADSLGQLTEQERLVVALYYYEELTLKEIGQVLELSESRVSQLHTKSVLSLRVKLRKRFMS
ncbi:MAG: FliA/WhiG family RNA polymerase sigma factor [Gemmatimonadetes bacterium]|jgi:RNA polymerase sigma factor FliA|nr:FliA/WhiG family RNA polymerase sigma factor [Gemmatimonadota bacterium]MBT7863375.1 FliA/WhiG family RNA polymerase sigma factor [Gemmatimonadota bacterium]